MSKPKLTVGIPTRNRSRLVTSLVHACLRQTEPIFEIVVSDNASDDDTIARLAEFNHPSLIVIRQAENIGMVGNWNACLESSSGDWFILLSDDDQVDPDFHEHAQRAIDSHRSADLLIMRCRIRDHISNQININPPPITTSGQVDFLREIFPAWLRHEFTMPLAGFIFRAEMLKSSAGFSNLVPFAADVATWLPIACLNNCAFWPEAKIDYVVHAGMTTRTFDFETLILDLLDIHMLIVTTIDKCTPTFYSRNYFRGLANVNLKLGFRNMLIISARKGAGKFYLLSTWIKYASRIPDHGISFPSLLAVVVPAFMFNIVGWPYRAWLAFKRRPKKYATMATSL